MSIEMKPGRWKQRDGRIAMVLSVQPLDGWPWKGVDADGEDNSWQNDGFCLTLHHVDDLDLIEYIGPLEGEAVSEKHEAAKRLLKAAQEMRDLLTEETDGTHVWQMIRTVVGNARAIEMSVAMDVADDLPDEDETDEGMFDAEDDLDS